MTSYLRPLDEDWPQFYFLCNDVARQTVAKFPWQTLDLIWRILRPAQRGQSRELGEVLDRIAQADPGIVRDRRYQLLLTRVMRIV